MITTKHTYLSLFLWMLLFNYFVTRVNPVRVVLETADQIRAALGSTNVPEVRELPTNVSEAIETTTSSEGPTNTEGPLNEVQKEITQKPGWSTTQKVAGGAVTVGTGALLIYFGPQIVAAILAYFAGGGSGGGGNFPPDAPGQPPVHPANALQPPALSAQEIYDQRFPEFERQMQDLLTRARKPGIPPEMREILLRAAENLDNEFWNNRPGTPAAPTLEEVKESVNKVDSRAGR